MAIVNSQMQRCVAINIAMFN